MPLTVLMTAMSLDLGGAETHVVSLARHLKARKHQVLVASAGGALVEDLQSRDIPHFHAPLNSRKPWGLLAASVYLGTLVRRFKVDVVHAHGRIPAWTSHMATRLSDVPLVTTYHGTYKASPVLRRLTKSGLISIAVSHDVECHLVENLGFSPARVRVIPNGIDLEVFRPRDVKALRKEFGFEPAQKVAVFVSRLDEDTLASASSFVAGVAMTPEVYGLVAGDGTKRVEVENLATEASRRAGRQAVLMLGGRTDVASILNTANVVVGAARVALEAMACGRPVVLCGEGGFVGPVEPHILEDLYRSNFTARGLGTPPTPEQIAEAVTSLLEDPTRVRQMVDSGLKFVHDRYSIEGVTGEVEGVYGQALAEVQRRRRV
ncbi:MAG: glycosyltransferase [Bacillota bacterium]